VIVADVTVTEVVEEQTITSVRVEAPEIVVAPAEVSGIMISPGRAVIAAIAGTADIGSEIASDIGIQGVALAENAWILVDNGGVVVADNKGVVVADSEDDRDCVLEEGSKDIPSKETGTELDSGNRADSLAIFEISLENTEARDSYETEDEDKEEAVGGIGCSEMNAQGVV